MGTKFVQFSHQQFLRNYQNNRASLIFTVYKIRRLDIQ